tara:strand:- start:160 stop:342 length:183 start_codon:yes stop_codon:yes gene_type:complete
MADYQLVKNDIVSLREGEEVLENIILRKADNTYIPKDPENRDYKEYLEWVSEGNTPDEAS